MQRNTTPLLDHVREAAGDRDNYGSVLTAHPDTRGGGQLQTAGSQPIETPACPTSALTRAPARDHQRRYARARTTNPQCIFMALQPSPPTRRHRTTTTRHPPEQPAR